MRINIDDVITEFGEHYVDGGQGLQNLQEVIMARTDFLSTYPLLPTEDTVVHKATASIGGVLQAFQKGFTLLSGNQVTFEPQPDRKSTRLNSSHVKISYAVFCLKKKNMH